MWFSRVGSLRCFRPLFLVQRSPFTTTSHASDDPKRISIPCRGSGSLTVDLYQPREHPSKPRIVLYIPAAISFHDGNVKQELGNDTSRIASKIRDAADATVVQINYRLGASPELEKASSVSDADPTTKGSNNRKTVHHAHPTPLHDVIAALDWVASDLVSARCDDIQGHATRIAVYGELNGGSMALTLAMTECRKGDAVQVGAVATRDAVVDWVSVSDQPSHHFLSDMKRKIFHPAATHPGSPFDPFISPIHFLRTPVHQVPLTAAQKAAKEAEQLGEAFKDIATLDDVLAQEAWIADDASSLSADPENYHDVQSKETTDILTENFSALQMADDGLQSVSLDLGEESHQRETDSLDERAVDEEYVAATNRMAIAKTLLDKDVENNAQPGSQEADVQNRTKAQPRRNNKPKEIGSSKSQAKAMMRHRKWPAIPGLLNIPHFRLCISSDKILKRELSGSEASTIAAQNQEMARLLQRAVVRESMAGIKDHFSGQDNSQLFSQSLTKARKGQHQAGLDQQEMEALLQKQVHLALGDEDDTAGEEQDEDHHVDSLVHWFEQVLWTKEEGK